MIFAEVADVFNLLDVLDDRYTLSLHGIPSILLNRFAAPITLSLYIFLRKS